VRSAEPHPPTRPLWLCGTCREAWPCQPAREALLAAYGRDRIGLCLYLSLCLADANHDLHALHPGDGPSAIELFRRFVGWARRPVPG